MCLHRTILSWRWIQLEPQTNSHSNSIILYRFDENKERKVTVLFQGSIIFGANKNANVLLNVSQNISITICGHFRLKSILNQMKIDHIIRMWMVRNIRNSVSEKKLRVKEMLVSWTVKKYAERFSLKKCAISKCYTHHQMKGSHSIYYFIGLQLLGNVSIGSIFFGYFC